MGVSAGNNCFNLVYADVPGTDEEGKANTEGWIYILDAGKQYYYINDENGVLGDGKIEAMRPDGTGVNTVLTTLEVRPLQTLPGLCSGRIPLLQ